MSAASASDIIPTAVGGLSREGLVQLLALARELHGPEEMRPPLFALLKRPDLDQTLKVVATHLHVQVRLAREASSPPDRAAAQSELKKVISFAIRQLISSGGEEQEPCNGRFVQKACDAVLQRGCRPAELVKWASQLDQGRLTREELLLELFELSAVEAAANHHNDATHDPCTLHVMGTGQRVTLQDWKARAEDIKRNPSAAALSPANGARYELRTPPRLSVTCIASLYRGGQFIRRFLENITSQSCFIDYAELIIIDAGSPDGEREVIAPFLELHSNIRYIRAPECVGIYEAWNQAVAEARGEYLTCTNVDDLRRRDSLALQAATLDALPFADVVYQDFFYSFDPTLTYDEVAGMGYCSRLPLVTPYSLLNYNPPHNAPMWRRRLHDELGLFDTRYQSAGDYDFWMRCLAAGKIFFKLNDPHVVYYQNPEGLSTRRGTRGFAETKAVQRQRTREILSELLVMPLADFQAQLTPLLPDTHDNREQDRARLCHRALSERARLKHGSPALRAAA